MLFLTVDVGRLSLVATGMVDATAVSARSAARQGYAGTNPAEGSIPCTSAAATGEPAYDAFCEAARRIPGAQLAEFRVAEPTSTTILGATCTIATGQVYVTVEASATLDLLTPGLGALLNDPGDGFGSTVTATGTARCEVAR